MITKRNPEKMIQLTVLLLCGLTVALVAVAAVLTDNAFSTEVLLALAVLSLFALAATNFDVTARAGLGISGNVMVLVASLVVFRDFGFFLGPVIVGCFGALDWTQLRERAWPKIAFNASADAVSLLAATLVFWSITSQPVAGSTVRLFIATALAAATYLLVHSPLISIPVALSCGEPYFKVLRQIAA